MSNATDPRQNASTLSRRQVWVAGARPRTLPASLVPVFVGSGAAVLADGFIWWRALLALVVSFALQVGVNYANDYSDGIRGTDEKRVGPLRLVGSGLASPRSVKFAAFACFGAAAAAGLVLAVVAAPWLIAVGIACILGAWFYTGGKRPYGYSGLGEVAVFVFFGLVATVGTTFVQTESFTSASIIAAFAVGALADALLVVNNLRDIPTDAATGKHTLAVRLGDRSTRWLYLMLIAVPFVVLVPLTLLHGWSAIALLAAVAAMAPARTVRSGATGGQLISVLQQTGKLQLAFGALLTTGFVL